MPGRPGLPGTGGGWAEACTESRLPAEACAYSTYHGPRLAVKETAGIGHHRLEGMAGKEAMVKPEAWLAEAIQAGKEAMLSRGGCALGSEGPGVTRQQQSSGPTSASSSAARRRASATSAAMKPW